MQLPRSVEGAGEGRGTRVLDEAASSLDAESERILADNLAPVLAGRIAFIVTHRLTTASSADLICVIDQGRIFERGPHEQLLARGCLYAHLWSVQTGTAQQE